MYSQNELNEIRKVQQDILSNEYSEYKGYTVVKSNKVDGWYMTKCETIVGECIAEVLYDLNKHIKEQNKNEKITVYTKSSLMGNIVKYEGKLIDCGTMKYAQYNNAPFVSFIPKRKRKGVRLVEGYNPYMLVLKGWGHPEPNDIMVPVSETETVTVTTTKYRSFDKQYGIDFNLQINEYLTKQDVLLDVR